MTRIAQRTPPHRAWVLLGTVVLLAAAPPPWGRTGHELTARAAGANLPSAMPEFFRLRTGQLTYLNYEPDRWRGDDARPLDRAFTYDHYVNLEDVPTGALRAADRWTYLRALQASGVEHPEQTGLLPFRIVELHQRLVRGFRLWRSAGAPERRWIEDRIVNDAGILGHYVADAANPLHTTIHHDGWAEDEPNPGGFFPGPGLHHRFEAEFVDVAVEAAEVTSRMAPDVPPAFRDVRRAVLDYIFESRSELERLYGLERDAGFDPDRPDPRAAEFATERLVAGSEMLRALWWSAWVESGRNAP